MLLQNTCGDSVEKGLTRIAFAMIEALSYHSCFTQTFHGDVKQNGRTTSAVRSTVVLPNPKRQGQHYFWDRARRDDLEYVPAAVRFARYEHASLKAMPSPSTAILCSETDYAIAQQNFGVSLLCPM